MSIQTTAVAQAREIVDFAGPLRDSLISRIGGLLTAEEARSYNKIILTGCGDSLAAGYAAKGAFEKYSGCRVTPMTTLDLSHYYSRKNFDYGKTLVLAVSVSGRVASVVDATDAAKSCGATVIAVTANTGSPAARAADIVLPHDVTEPGPIPGTRTYFASVMTLMLFALKMGEWRGKLTGDEVKTLTDDMVGFIESWRSCMESIDAKSAAVAKTFAPLGSVDFVGSGLDYATAWFARAKMYEAVGKVSCVENTEDWCHVNYFFKDTRDIGALLFLTGDSPAKSRALEAVKVMTRIGRPTAVVTDLDPSEFGDGVEVIQVPAPKHGWMNPLMQFIPASLITGYAQVELGENPYRGFDGVFETGNRIYANRKGGGAGV